MAETGIPSAPFADAKHHVTFFRQSGWMMVATVGGGVLMFAVHSVAQRMPKEEYGVFTTLIQVVSLMGIPTVGLSGIFAQQAAGAMTPDHERALTGVFRGVLRGTFGIWLLMAALALVFRQPILEALKISNSAALYMAIVIGLTVLWRPIAQGVLQGRQNFLWLGNVNIADGIGRFGCVLVAVGLLKNFAAGAMFAVLTGTVIAMSVAGWFCRDCLRGEATPMAWGAWLRRVVPMTLGLGVGTFMLAADMIFVQKYFPREQTGYYAAAGTIGRALVYFTAPIAAVMYPKLARSAATGEKSNALLLALGITALAGVAAAVMCSFFPALPLRLARYGTSYLEISAPLIPWFAWCMLPLTLATVLINSLMAHSQFKAVPWLVAVAAGYGTTLYVLLQRHHDDFKPVIQTIGVFGLLLLAVCSWFTWGVKSPKSGDA